MPGKKQIKWQKKLEAWNENPKGLDEINTIFFDKQLIDFPPKKIDSTPLPIFKTLKAMAVDMGKLTLANTLFKRLRWVVDKETGCWNIVSHKG